MIRGLLIFISFISVILFPWPITAILVIATSFFIPLAPLAVGIFADTLYYTPQTTIIPFLTILGALMTGIAFFVRSRLMTSTMGR